MTEGGSEPGTGLEVDTQERFRQLEQEVEGLRRLVGRLLDERASSRRHGSASTDQLEATAAAFRLAISDGDPEPPPGESGQQPPDLPKPRRPDSE